MPAASQHGDERDLAEIRCEEKFPGERLVVCRNPLLAQERSRKREELLQATEAALEKVRLATLRDKHPLRGEGAIAERVAKAARWPSTSAATSPTF